MHTRQSKLFESGGETIKRNLMEQYSMPTIEKKKQGIDNTGELREQVSKLSNELQALKLKPQLKDEETQFDNKNFELMNDLIKQKDKSIEQYEKQILSFKNMILQKNNQVKELLNKLERNDPMKKSQILKTTQCEQTDFMINKISQSQQTEVDLGLLFGVKQKEILQQPPIMLKYSQQSQTEAKFYSEIMMLNQDQMYHEIEQYKKIMREYDLENRALKEKVTSLSNSTTVIYTDIDIQTEGLEMIDGDVQVEDSLRQDQERLIIDFFKSNEEKTILQKQLKQQAIDTSALKGQYDELVSDYYFLQSESKANKKQIREFIDEIELLKQELQSKDPSVGSAETVTSPKDSQRSFKKKTGGTSKIKPNLNNLNPQNVDELLLCQEENQRLQAKLGELKCQLLDAQRTLRSLQEDIQIKDQLINQLNEDIFKNKEQYESMKEKVEKTANLEFRLQESEDKCSKEITLLQQRLGSLNSDYVGLRVINQTLHIQLEKYQSKLKLLQQNSP